MRRLSLSCVLLVLAAAIAGAADTAPDWVMEMSSRSIPSYPGEVRSAVLFDEARVTVSPDGTIERTLRYAVRILNVDGKQDAYAALPYFQRYTKIKDFHAWLVVPGGGVRSYGKESIVDVSEKADFELYSDMRIRAIHPSSTVPGATFAWSASSSESALLFEDRWTFQQRMPVLLSRYSLTVPAGWEAKAETFNLPNVQPTRDGTTYTWEAKNLDLLKPEPEAPQLSSLAPWLGVSFYPAGAAASDKAVRTWSDLSRWQCHLADSQADASPRMTAKVQELTAQASTPFAKIQALGRYVQQLQYVAIETNQARGGGYQPHLASQVFEKQYGDCKDKANLLRAMLRIAGIDSYLVTIYAGDRDSVHPEWVAPGQFNHMILAIKVPTDVSVPAVLNHPTLGRLLIFDPTSSPTPVGQLPADEQNSYALVLAGANGDLLRMPLSAPDVNRMNVDIAATLTGTGAIEASVALAGQGESAARLRGVFTYAAPDQFRGQLEHWISATTQAPSLSTIEPKDDPASGTFQLKLGFKAPVYGQLMQQRMLVFRPAVTERLHGFRVQSDARKLPVALDTECYHKQVHMKLPAGFSVDELPDATEFSTGFGKFAASYKVDGSDLLFTEDLDVSAVTLPPSQYADVKSFFQHVAGAEQAPVLLVKN